MGTAGRRIRGGAATVGGSSGTGTGAAARRRITAYVSPPIGMMAQQEISRIYSQAWEQQQRVQSGLAQQYSQYIRGVETYVDRISGERVELASGHGQAWSNGRGEYILSNDSNFNPSIAFRERWEEMPRLERPR